MTKKKTTDLTKKTIDLFKKEGWLVERTERWNSFAKIRQDLFGFGDVLAAREDNGIVILQVTSRAHHAARRKKILESDRAVKWVCSGGRILVISWASKVPEGKKRPIWDMKAEEIVEDEDDRGHLRGGTVQKATFPNSSRTSSKSS